MSGGEYIERIALSIPDHILLSTLFISEHPTLRVCAGYSDGAGDDFKNSAICRDN